MKFSTPSKDFSSVLASCPRDFFGTTPKIRCNSGLELFIQDRYSKEKALQLYLNEQENTCEVSHVSKEVNDFVPYTFETKTRNIFAFVPKSVIAKVILENGGIIETMEEDFK